MKTIYAILALLFVGNFGFGQTTVTYDFSAAGASTSANLDSNISFTTAVNGSTTAPFITDNNNNNINQLRLDEDATKGGSIIITPQNGVTITNVVVNASIKINDAAYTIDGGIEIELSGSNNYLISGITALTEVEFYQKQNGNNKEIYVDNFEVTYTVPGPVTYTYTAAWSPSDPNGTSSVTDNIIVASGNATISANTAVSDVTVNPGASLTVNTGITLTASEVTLESASNSYSSLMHDGTIVGSIKYERYVNSTGNGKDLISPPLSGETWANFLSSDTNAADLLDDGNTSPTTYLFGPFDKVTEAYLTYTDATSTTLTTGTGYRAATDIGTTLTFTGTVPTGDITVDIDYSGTNYPDWNLIGNPYPSYIHIGDFLNQETAPGKNNIDIFFPNTGIYAYSGRTSLPEPDGPVWDVISVANAGTRLMAPGQGFLVPADTDDSITIDLTFNEAMRRTGTGDDFIAGRDANALVFLNLGISKTGKWFNTEFYFNSNASQGADHGYDATLLGSIAPSFALYSHLVQDNTGLPMALQALHPSDLANVTIPLGVNANQGEQLTFSIRETALPSAVNVYLEDNVLNTSTLLNSSDYTLTPNTNVNGTGRFYLSVTNNTLSIPENALDHISIYSDQADKTIVIAGQLFEPTTVYVYDLQGRIVSTSVMETTHRSQFIDVSNLSTGGYIVKLFNGTQQKTQKVIIH